MTIPSRNKTFSDKELLLDTNMLHQRGWTKTLIKQFLGDPDYWMPVPHWLNYIGKRTWLISNIIRAEQTNNFQKAYQASIRRRRLTREDVEKFALNWKSLSQKVFQTTRHTINNKQHIHLVSNRDPSRLYMLSNQYYFLRLANLCD